MTNLIVNAVVHGFENRLQGEIVIRAEKSEKGGCLLTVTDNGRGMPPDVVSRVFEPFFTTKRGSGGSGLGLSIVYNLVTQQLGGAIRCESVEGKMTRFTLTVPSKV
jgi:signal transduction histidine kinase